MRLTRSIDIPSLGIALLVVFGLFLVNPYRAHAEQIQLFDSQIEIVADGTYTVTETIEYQFTEPRHGIFREIPRSHPDASEHIYTERYTDIAVVSVLKDDSQVPHTVSYDRDRVRIQIGDPDTFVDGAHTYTIVYTVSGGISAPKNQGVELYFNVTGTEWQVPIRMVTSRVTSSDSILRSTRSCYRGYVDVSNGSCTQNTDTEGNLVYVAEYLNPGEGVTIAQALDPSKVVPEKKERVRLGFLVVFSLLGVLGIGAFIIHRIKTRHRTGRTIIPQYVPFPECKPMYTGLLMDGRLDARDITAGIVTLARDGYLAIHRTEKKVLFFFEVDDYVVTLKKIPAEDSSFFEARLATLLFGESPTVNASISLSDLKNNLTKQRENAALLSELRKDLSEDLIADGFYQHPLRLLSGALALLTFVLGGTLLLVLFMQAEVIPTVFALGGIAIVGAVFLYRRRTRKGYEALDYLKGFKLFLSMTERDRYAFHNAPEKSPKEFMEYLPYAIAFGVEKEWAKVFEGMMIPNPEWYSGGTPGSFTASSLTSSLGAFSTAFAQSSGSSASSGGGSVGGGSGGGGGGSW